MITNELLAERYPKFAEFANKKGSGGKMGGEPPDAQEMQPAPAQKEEDETPEETTCLVYGIINEQLAGKLPAEIMNQTPVFFERLVIELMQAMRYGVGKENTKHSGDEGIDCVIYEDKPGCDKICIRAKRWERGTTVGRPERQKFFGAVSGKGKGLFITTAKFSQGAQAYADEKRIIPRRRPPSRSAHDRVRRRRF